MQVRVLREAASLRELVPAWDELAASALEPNPFYESWLLLPAIEYLGGTMPEVATVWKGDRLHAFMPLAREAGLKGLPVKAMSAWRHRHCLLCTPLVRAGKNAVDALGALLDWMAEGRQGAAALELSHIPAGGAFHAALAEAMAARELAAVTTGWHTRAVLRRAASAEAYMEAALSRDTRKNCGKYEKQLRERGAVAWRRLAAGEDARPWIEEFLALESGGWKGRAGSALASCQASARFAREAMASAAAQGRLLISGIDCDSRPIARLATFTAGGGSFAFKTAYDESFKRCAPGILAEVQNIRDFHASGALDWMDSYTAAGNTVTDRLWKDRLVMLSFAVGLSWPGRIACAALPLLALGRRAAGGLRAGVAALARNTRARLLSPRLSRGPLRTSV
jgi:CelD/BcsL family acetyltransferase involved in cellulose biosynthesis